MAQVPNESLVEALREELNVDVVRFEDNMSSLEATGVKRVLQVNARRLGPRLGKQVQDVIRAAKAGQWTELDGKVFVEKEELQEGEYEFEWRAPAGAAVGFLEDGTAISLDTHVSPTAEAEGLTRDVLRAVQLARREAGLDVSDRISIKLIGQPELLQVFANFKQLFASEALAVNLQMSQEAQSSIAEATKAIHKSLEPLTLSVKDALRPMSEALQPLSEALATVGSSLAPLTETVQHLGEALTPVHEALSQSMQEALKPVESAAAEIRESLTVSGTWRMVTLKVGLSSEEILPDGSVFDDELPDEEVDEVSVVVEVERA